MKTLNISYEDKAFQKIQKIKVRYMKFHKLKKIAWDRIIYVALSRLEEDGKNVK
jgi:hypothetical protein